MTCVTLDHDFHAHLAQSSANGPSVVFLRIQKLRATGQAQLIAQVWERCESAIERGSAISTNGHSIRIRALPIN